jgi:hypothetical protein
MRREGNGPAAAFGRPSGSSAFLGQALAPKKRGAFLVSASFSVLPARESAQGK